MKGTTMTRRIALIIAACMLGLAGFQAAVAEAHIAQVVISCDSVGFNYTKFPNQANTASYSVTVSSGSGSQAGVFSWTGKSFAGSLPINAVGSSTVTASTTWTADGGGSASQTLTLACQAPPTTTTAPPPPKVCPDGLPPQAGHDGQSGNDDCVHTTAVVTTSTTTPTNVTSTTPTTPTTPTTTNQTTTTNQGTAPITTTPTSGPTGGRSNGTHTAPTQANPQLQGVLAKQATTSGSRVSAERRTSGQLPFTGFRTWIIALVGSAMLVAGLGIRRLAA
jgi:hypothetical protein